MKISTTLKRMTGLAMVLFFGFSLSMGQYSPGDFINPIPIPYLAKGVDSAETTTIHLDFANTTHNFDPNGATDAFVPQTPGDPNRYKINETINSWAINSNVRTPANAPDMTFLGPTLLWRHGRDIRMRVTNSLPSQSNEHPGHGDNTTSHWHGLNVHAQGDGGPHQAIPNTPGPMNPWSPNFPMVDPAQTLWYHSHVMEFTTEQVILGLAGMIIVEDTTDETTVALTAALPHTYNENDFPLVIQEKGFNYSRDTVGMDTLQTATSLNVSERPGDGEFRTINGIALGQLSVPNQVIRLRILNGDPRKSYCFGFSTNIDTSDHSSRLTFYQIATDGGFMGKPHPISYFIINPGERGEFLLNLTEGALSGQTEIFMSNLASVPEASGTKDIVGLGGDKTNSGPLTAGLAFMRFDVDSSLVVDSTNRIFSIADSSLFPPYTLDECDPNRMRTKNLLDSLKNQPPSGMWTIDHEPMDMTKLNDTVCVNTCEEWTIINHTPVAHPFHIHKVQFQIKQYIDRSDSNNVKQYDFPNLPSNMMGYKDVIIVRKNSQVTFQARFDMFGEDTIKANNGYMYHCHILTHEDFSMMHQFTVVTQEVCQEHGLLNTSVEEDLEAPFSFYPNPAEDIVYIKGHTTRAGTMRFTDMLGRVLRTQQIAPFSEEIPVNVADLPKGLTLIEFIYDDMRHTAKIILE